MNITERSVPKSGLKLSVNMPDGTTDTRRTNRVYNHVVATRGGRFGTWAAFSWHSTEELAIRAQRSLLESIAKHPAYYSSGSNNVEADSVCVLPVEMDENWCRLAEADPARQAARRLR